MYNPLEIYMIWDERRGDSSTRSHIMADYKGNRSSDNSMHQNNKTIVTLLNYLGIQSLYPLNLEADDIAAYIALTKPGEKVIVSVDKDFLQLITKDLCVYEPIRKVEYNIRNFEEKTGYKDPEEWYKAKLVLGDKSDNVAGVKGFGKVTTRKYLDGKIELTKEQQKITERNDSVFNLKKFEGMPDEIAFYEKQLSDKPSPNSKNFFEMCRHAGYNSILSKKQEWNRLFYHNKVLLNLFS
jgi:5'-3' exonuclease